MAVGDTISAFSSAPNTVLHFQPAAGVEVMITTAHNPGATNLSEMRLHNGTKTSSLCNLGGPAANMKMMINNTNYLEIGSMSGVHTAFTGIQTK